MITLSKYQGMWVASNDDPQVTELFGTDTLPTPFADTVPYEVVQQTIQKLNKSTVVV